MTALRALARTLAAVGWLSWCASLAAQPTDTAVKAAFLPRFFRYVTWPAGAMPRGSDPFVLCVIGRDPFGSALDDAASSQSIDGRRIVVRRLDSTSAADGCQIAFLSPGGSQFAPMPARPVLTVTDAATGGPRGMIHFMVVDGRVRFFIDQRAAMQRGLTISSRLLALAVGVRK